MSDGRGLHPDHPARALAEGLLSGRVSDGEEGLGRVHARVDATVAVEPGHLAVPGVDRHPRLVVPEVLVIGLDGLLQQLLGVRTAEQVGGARGEHDEGVRVADLRALVVQIRGAVGPRAQREGRIPAAVLVVVQMALEAGEHVVDDLLRAREAQHRAEAVDVRHAAGDPGLHALGWVDAAEIIQPAGASHRGGGTAAEAEEVVSLVVQPRAVRLGAELVFAGGPCAVWSVESVRISGFRAALLILVSCFIVFGSRFVSRGTPDALMLPHSG